MVHSGLLFILPYDFIGIDPVYCKGIFTRRHVHFLVAIYIRSKMSLHLKDDSETKSQNFQFKAQFQLDHETLLPPMFTACTDREFKHPIQNRKVLMMSQLAIFFLKGILVVMI